MIQAGVLAPDFTLLDQFGRPFTLGFYRGRRAVLLNFYPLDFTPICSGEVPRLNALQHEFLTRANTVAVAISADSRFSHNAWCADLGGICIPVLADSHPHGAVSQRYGLWIPSESITDRGSVLVGLDGRVVWTVYAGKEGRRDVDGLLDAAARAIGPGAPARRPAFALPESSAIFLSTTCPRCRAVAKAAKNAGVLGSAPIRVVDKDETARLELERMELPGGPAVPVMRLGVAGPVLVGDGPIIATIANASCPVP